jgi:hypothetical protein
MSNTIGDGMVALALAGGITSYFYMKHQARQKRLELIHQERMAAMEKGIPLPEFPLEPAEQRRHTDALVVPILGMVLFTLSIGAMIVLFLNLPASARSFWVAPIPIAFLGVGFLAFHFLSAKIER